MEDVQSQRRGYFTRVLRDGTSQNTHKVLYDLIIITGGIKGGGVGGPRDGQYTTSDPTFPLVVVSSEKGVTVNTRRPGHPRG